MKRWIAAGILILAMTGCSRYEPAKEMTRAQEESVQSEASGAPVSYTHLDVYKRQPAVICA